MLDLAALPIAFALTLWDAVPVYLPVGVAVALVFRVLTTHARFQRYWDLRSSLGIEGVVFAALFYVSLVPVLIAGSVLATALAWRSSGVEESAPDTPGRVIRQRAEELLGGILLASGLSALVKVGSTAVTAPPVIEPLLALLVGAVCGFRSGAVAIPAVAIAVHLGGMFPAAVCVVASILAAPLYQRVTARRQNDGDVVRSTPD